MTEERDTEVRLSASLIGTPGPVTLLASVDVEPVKEHGPGAHDIVVRIPMGPAAFDIADAIARNGLYLDMKP